MSAPIADLPPLDEVCALAGAAAEAIMRVYARDDFDVREKDDRSPLTAADLASHKVIVEGLRALTPDIPVLSEESADIDWDTRRQWSRYWLVDPLDGTDRKSTRLNSSHVASSYAVFCLKKNTHQT